MRPLLDPPETLGLPPENVVAVLGQRDQYVSYEWAREILDAWKVPDSGVVTWEVDHFGLLVRLYRKNNAQALIMGALDRVGSTQ